MLWVKHFAYCVEELPSYFSCNMFTEGGLNHIMFLLLGLLQGVYCFSYCNVKLYPRHSDRICVSLLKFSLLDESIEYFVNGLMQIGVLPSLLNGLWVASTRLRVMSKELILFLLASIVIIVVDCSIYIIYIWNDER